MVDASCSQALPPLAAVHALSAGCVANATRARPDAACAVSANPLRGALMALELEGSIGTHETARAFCELSGEASVTACAGRIRRDIGEQAAADVASMMGTQWATTLIKTITPPIVMAMLTPFVLSFIQFLMPFINEKLIPPVVSGARDPIVTAISMDVEINIGMSAASLLDPKLSNVCSLMLIRSLNFHLPRVLGRELAPQLAQYLYRYVAPRYAKELAHRLVHSLTHRLTRAISDGINSAVTERVTHALGHKLIHYYYCVYCYTLGDFCHYCHAYAAFVARLGAHTSSLDRFARASGVTQT